MNIGLWLRLPSTLKMVIPSLQVIGCLLTVASMVGCLCCILMTDWKHTVYDETDSRSEILQYEGLWSHCYHNLNGYFHCKAMSDPFPKLPGVVRESRVLILVTAGLLLNGFVTALLGMQCTNMVKNPITKFSMSILATLHVIGASTCLCVAVNRYTADVNESYDPAKINFLNGKALAIGWAASASGFIAGICILCGSCTGKTSSTRNFTAQRSYPNGASTQIMSNNQRTFTPVTVLPRSERGERYKTEVYKASTGGHETVLTLPPTTKSSAVSDSTSTKTPSVDVSSEGNSTTMPKPTVIPIGFYRPQQKSGRIQNQQSIRLNKPKAERTYV